MSFQTVQQTEPLHSLFPFTPLCGSFCTNGAATTSKQSANFRQSGLVAIYLGKYSVFLQKGLLTSHWSCSSSPAFKWLWKSSCQNKHKVFFWLLLKDRLSTRNLLRRKTMVLDSYECEFCNSGQEETLEHLFLRCPFATACWTLIHLHVLPQISIFKAIDSFKEQLHAPSSLEIIIFTLLGYLDLQECCHLLE